MNITLKGRLYYFACGYLWGALALYDYLLEKGPFRNMSSTDLDLGGLLDPLAGWAIEEKYFPASREAISATEQELLHSTTNRLLPPNVESWSNDLTALAITINQQNPQLTPQVWLQYCYHQFVCRVLTQFDELVRDLDDSELYYNRFLVAHDMVERIWEACLGEQLSLGVDPARTIDVVSGVEDLAKRWTQAIQTAAQSLD